MLIRDGLLIDGEGGPPIASSSARLTPPVPTSWPARSPSPEEMGRAKAAQSDTLASVISLHV